MICEKWSFSAYKNYSSGTESQRLLFIASLASEQNC